MFANAPPESLEAAHLHYSLKIARLRAGIDNRFNCLWLKIAHVGPPFLTQDSPQKCLSESVFWRSLSVTEAHNLFWGPKMGLVGWGAEVYVENIMCFFLSLIDSWASQSFPPSYSHMTNDGHDSGCLA